MRRRLAALFLLTGCCAAQQTPVIRVPVRLVSVPTLVFSRDGRLISGLQVSDFRLLDNGRPQRLKLDTESNAVSIAMVVQRNLEVREYLPFVARTGNLIDALLTGETGESALVTCNDEVQVAKPFESGDLPSAIRQLTAVGHGSRLIDAASRAIGLLRQRPPSRARVVLLIGQPMDRGSETTLAVLCELAERENVSIFALALPELGKAFVSDTFTLDGLPRDRGGFRAGTDLKNLVTVLDKTAAARQGGDPFSVLTAATGGTLIHFRKQKELEGALAAIGTQLRGAYILSYSPDPTDAGYHTIAVEVAASGAKVYARPGYSLR
jgi:VWFA-related protein